MIKPLNFYFNFDVRFEFDESGPKWNDIGRSNYKITRDKVKIDNFTSVSVIDKSDLDNFFNDLREKLNF